jgi:ATP-dependent Lhr-like helicase
MESENLLAAVFPDQLACLENIAGDREVPDHPLVRQTIDDCLLEAMDIDGLEALLRRIETGTIQCIARELPEPSPLAHEILNARPYAFLDNAPLEERRTQAVYTRRAAEAGAAQELGILDAAAIDRVCEDAWPRATTPDELHDVLLQLGVATPKDLERSLSSQSETTLETLLGRLVHEHRAARVVRPHTFWTAAERVPIARAAYPKLVLEPHLEPAGAGASPDAGEAVRELLRGRLEICGPVTGAELAEHFKIEPGTIEQGLLALETEGFILRGTFRPGATEVEWCDRRLLARIHRLTLNRLRAEIQPVPIADFIRFLLVWQHVAPGHRLEGPEGVGAIIGQLDGCEAPAAAWEPALLASRVEQYTPEWLDRLCYTGRVGWGRLSIPQAPLKSGFTPLRSSPIALFTREHLADWIELASPRATADLSSETELVFRTLSNGGALFFGEIAQRTGLLRSRVEQALGELTAHGRATADSFEGLRALLVPADKRAPLGDPGRKRRHKAISSIEYAGRWTVLRPLTTTAPDAGTHPGALEQLAWTLLRRYGVVFRRLIEREVFRVSWFELSRVYRRLEARGEIRGGYFISGASGEQFALPEAVGSLRLIRRTERTGELVLISAADPLNLSGILTPGPRVPALGGNRILLRDGVPLAALVSGEVQSLNRESEVDSNDIARALKVGRIAPSLRRYYA